MDKAARLRWSILLGALVLTIAAIVYPVDKSEGGDTVISAERSVSRAAHASPAIEQDSAEPMETEAEVDDPFAPRGWQAPPAATVTTVENVVAAAAPAVLMGPPVPPAPPPLPYKFMGRLDDAGVEVVYLSKGDQPIIARSGETLDGNYKILAMNAQQIEFEFLPTGDKQTLTIPTSEK